MTLTLDALSDDELAALIANTADSIVADGAVDLDFDPLPQQRKALDSPADLVLYGGAAGGGKTFLGLAMLRLYQKNGIFFRRTYPELEASAVQDSRALFGSADKDYNGSKHLWEFGDGCRIKFSHLEREDDVFSHQSAQYDGIVFDEVTHFSESQFVYMLSRLRNPKHPNLRKRILCCTNPGGPGNDWVMRWWADWLDKDAIDPAQPGEVRHYVRIEGRDRRVDGPGWHTVEGERLMAMSRTFIPAKISDNPYLEDDYAAKLQALPEPYRSQLLEGDWQAGLVDDAYQVIPTAWIRAAMERGRGYVWPTTTPDAVGVDVARGGEDSTVINSRWGDVFGPLTVKPGRETPDGASVEGLAVEAVRGHRGVPINIDVIGWGASPHDSLKAAGYNVEGVNFAHKSRLTAVNEQYQFINLRAECWWRMREALDPQNGRSVVLPDDPELLADLKAPRFEVRANGLKIESKEDIRERIGRSPDRGDAVVLANYRRELPGKPLFPGLAPSIHKPAYEPRVRWDEPSGAWLLDYPHMLGLDPMPGVLLRSAWVDRYGESVCLWAHWSADRVLIQFDALRIGGGVDYETFVKRVAERSHDDRGARHVYRVNAVSGPMPRAGSHDAHMANLMARALDRFEPRVDERGKLRKRGERHERPKLVEPARLRGAMGLDWVTRALEGARTSEGDMLLVWSDDVFQAMQDARRTPAKFDADPDADEPQEPVGGAVVRCLQMMGVGLGI